MKRLSKLSEYYHKIIASENYMQFDQSNQSQIIFPVEHSVYLADNYPHLNGVFAESRKLLRERVERMKNRTSIEACIEELQQRNKMLDISIQEATEWQSLLEIELGKLEKNRARTNKELQEYEESHKEIEKKYEHWKATFDEVKDAVNRIPKKKLMTEKQAADFWYSCSGTSDEEQAQLYQWLYRKIEDWLGKKEPVHKKLTDQLMQCAVRALNQEDLPDMLQQRDRRGFLWLEKWYGPASREHASWRADKIASSVYEKMKNVIMAYERDEGGILCSLLKEAKANLQKAKAEQRRTENKCRETAEALERCSQNIMYYRAQMEGNVANQRKVKRVFIEHYRKKEKNLYGRIEKATEPEIKAALFLTLSAINLTMKPYLEECNHGESEGIR